MNDTHDDDTSRATVAAAPAGLFTPDGLVLWVDDGGVLALRAVLRGLSDVDLRARADRLQVEATRAHEASEAPMRATDRAEARAAATGLAEDAAAARAALAEDNRLYALLAVIDAEERAVWTEQSRRAHVLQGGAVVAPAWLRRLVCAIATGVDAGLELVRLCLAALVLGLVGAWLAPYLLPDLTAAQRAQTVGVAFELILIAAVAWWAVPDRWFARRNGTGRAGR